GLAGAELADRGALAFFAAQLDDGTEAFDRTGLELERRLVRDELAPLGVVGIGKQRGHRHVDEVRIAIERLAIRIGELGAFDVEVDEIGAGRIQAIEVEALDQRQLLEHDRSLPPWAGLAYGEAAVVVSKQRLDAGLPAREVVAPKHATVGRAGHVHHVLAAAEPVDRLGHETFGPDLSRALDLALA